MNLGGWRRELDVVLPISSVVVAYLISSPTLHLQLTTIMCIRVSSSSF